MSDRLYERDALAWAEQQAVLLRRLAAGELLNAVVDWANVIEEVQDVGLSELRACRSLLVQALVHLLKLRAWPDSAASAHWRGEVAGFLADARDRFTPSMRQRVDLAALYADALHRVRSGAEDVGETRGLPGACPFGLDDLLGDRPDVTALAGRLGRDGHPGVAG